MVAPTLGVDPVQSLAALSRHEGGHAVVGVGLELVREEVAALREHALAFLHLRHDGFPILVARQQLSHFTRNDVAAAGDDDPPVRRPLDAEVLGPGVGPPTELLAGDDLNSWCFPRGCTLAVSAVWRRCPSNAGSVAGRC